MSLQKRNTFFELLILPFATSLSSNQTETRRLYVESGHQGFYYCLQTYSQATMPPIAPLFNTNVVATGFLAPSRPIYQTSEILSFWIPSESKHSAFKNISEAIVSSYDSSDCVKIFAVIRYNFPGNRSELFVRWRLFESKVRCVAYTHEIDVYSKLFTQSLLDWTNSIL